MNQPVYDPAPGSRPPLRGGLLLLLDIFSAPKRAFATIGQTREWLPAFILVAALGVAGSLLLAPALEHLIGVQAAANPGGASSAADLSRMTGYEVADVIIWQTLGQVMLWVWTAVILAGVAGSGPKTFGLYFALAANVALPAAVGFFISSCVIALHDPHAYANIAQLNRAFPDSLAIFEPRDNDRAVTFLASFDLFGLWSTLLLAFGLRALGKVELFWALIAAFTLWLAFALLQMVAGF